MRARASEACSARMRPRILRLSLDDARFMWGQLGRGSRPVYVCEGHHKVKLSHNESAISASDLVGHFRAGITLVDFIDAVRWSADELAARVGAEVAT